MNGPSFFAPSGGDRAPSSSFLVYGSVRPPPPDTRPPPGHTRPVPIPRALDLPTPVTCMAPSYGTIDPLPIPYIVPRGVPDQASTSLPGYYPLPQSLEVSLLLAPPPRYCHCQRDTDNHSHGDNICGRRARGGLGDIVVTILIVLNVLVWTVVIWGLCVEWTPSTTGGYEDLGGVVFA